MTGLKVLLTGATGYIGGSVLTHLLGNSATGPESIDLCALVRGEDRAKVLKAQGVQVELFETLEDTQAVERIASKYDVVISCVIGFHSASACAFIRGLDRRSKETGKQTYYIHTSGQSNLSDRPQSGAYLHSPRDRIFSDLHDDLYAYERAREAQHPYIQRAADLAVVEAGLATLSTTSSPFSSSSTTTTANAATTGVRTTILMPPTVYGLGTGPFNRLSVQIPTLFRLALKHGRAVQVGSEPATWNYVHVEDLAALYGMVLERLLATTGEEGEEKDVPSGAKGILFATGGRFDWGDMSGGVARALVKRGLVATEEVKTLSLAEAAAEMTGGDEGMVEVGFAGNSNARADVATSWGWVPEKTQQDWLDTFEIEADEVLKTSRKALYESHLHAH